MDISEITNVKMSCNHRVILLTKSPDFSFLMRWWNVTLSEAFSDGEGKVSEVKVFLYLYYYDIIIYYILLLYYTYILYIYPLTLCGNLYIFINHFRYRAADWHIGLRHCISVLERCYYRHPGWIQAVSRDWKSHRVVHKLAQRFPGLAGVGRHCK